MTHITTIQEKQYKIKEIATEEEEVKKKECILHFGEKARLREFQEGELVWLRTQILRPKMDLEWEVPYDVTARLDETTYQLVTPNHPGEGSNDM